MPRELLYNFRQRRGMELAATRTLRQKRKDVWFVPSQSGTGYYTVDLTGSKPTCTCADHKTHSNTCKHIYAVAYAAKKVGLLRVKRPTYPQKWPLYNTAQAVEKEWFQRLLSDLCATLPSAPPKTGRPPLSVGDAIFTATFKVYSTFSARRFFKYELQAAQEAGFISRIAKQATIHNILGDSAITPTLHSLIERSAVPLVPIEHAFAVDSSGLKTTVLVAGVDKKGELSVDHASVKCHIMCGVKTNIVTAVEIAGPDTYDGAMAPSLLEKTQRNFRVSELSADKGYSSKELMEMIGSAGVIPFIAFPDHVTGKKGGHWWLKMYVWFIENSADYHAHYHKRSNVETTFSMVKKKFGKFLRSRTDTALVNEALCKFLAHNIVVLIHEMLELGIVPDFMSPETKTAHRVVLQSKSLHAV